MALTPPVAAAQIDVRRTRRYRLAHAIFVSSLRAWFRPVITGPGQVPAEGPVVLAPVHRSFADFGFCGVLTDRKLFFMAKEELWRRRWLGRLLVALGAFPVHRQGVDRESISRAQEVLEKGQLLIMFPEGTRQAGPEVRELHDGVAFLAARTGAVMVPVGIAGSDLSMPKGTKIPKRLPIVITVGEPVNPPVPGKSGRVTRSQLRESTAELRSAIQAAYDEALRARSQLPTTTAE